MFISQSDEVSSSESNEDFEKVCPFMYHASGVKGGTKWVNFNFYSCISYKQEIKIFALRILHQHSSDSLTTEIFRFGPIYL